MNNALGAIYLKCLLYDKLYKILLEKTPNTNGLSGNIKCKKKEYKWNMMCVRIHTGAICMQNCFSETNYTSSYKFVNDSVSSVQQQLVQNVNGRRRCQTVSNKLAQNIFNKDTPLWFLVSC